MAEQRAATEGWPVCTHPPSAAARSYCVPRSSKRRIRRIGNVVRPLDYLSHAFAAARLIGDDLRPSVQRLGPVVDDFQIRDLVGSKLFRSPGALRPRELWRFLLRHFLACH